MVDRTMPALLRSLRNRVTSLERRISRGTYQLPDRLAPNGEQVTDWNTALAAGFYWSEDAANGPRSGALVGVVRVVGGGTFQGRLVQEVSIPTGVGAQYPMTWRRVWTGTAWTTWAIISGARHAEYTGSFSVANGGSGATAIPTPTLDPAFSTDTSFASPISGGFSLAAGLYLINTALNIPVSPVANLTRFFASLSAPITPAQRFITGNNDDWFQGEATVYLPTAGNVSISIYQASGAARTVTHRTRVTLLGGTAP